MNVTPPIDGTSHTPRSAMSHPAEHQAGKGSVYSIRGTSEAQGRARWRSWLVGAAVALTLAEGFAALSEARYTYLSLSGLPARVDRLTGRLSCYIDGDWWMACRKYPKR